MDPENVAIVEEVAGSDIPVELRYVETWDGLYAARWSSLTSG